MGTISTILRICRKHHLLVHHFSVFCIHRSSHSCQNLWNWFSWTENNNLLLTTRLLRSHSRNEFDSFVRNRSRVFHQRFGNSLFVTDCSLQCLALRSSQSDPSLKGFDKFVVSKVFITLTKSTSVLGTKIVKSFSQTSSGSGLQKRSKIICSLFLLMNFLESFVVFYFRWNFQQIQQINKINESLILVIRWIRWKFSLKFSTNSTKISTDQRKF